MPSGTRLRALALAMMVFFSLLPAPARAAPLPAAQSNARRPAAGVYLRDDWAGVAAQVPWAQGSAVNIGWRQIEPEAGRFDFSRIDRLLAALNAAGKKAAIGVLLRCEDDALGIDACAPAWALSWDPVMAGGRPRLNYVDARVQGALAELVNALARRYAADPRLSLVQINLGFDGAAAPCPVATNVAGGAEECAAYRAHYADPAAAWQQYASATLAAYSSSFTASGGAGHTPLQVGITGSFVSATGRGALVGTAVKLGIGLHDQALAAAYLTGEGRETRCAVDAGGRVVRAAGDPSHWLALEQHAGEVALTGELNQWPVKAEASLTDEENLWWSVLNALDKRVSVLYADLRDTRWPAPWQFFARYAGRTANNTPDGWVALRGSSPAWCGDPGDYGYFVQHRQEAAGDSSVVSGPTRPGGRAGSTWEGAYSRATDVNAGKPSLYFDVDDSLLYGGDRVVQVEVSYWDGTQDMAGLAWELAYDSNSAANQVAGSVTLRGTGRWLEHPFVLVDATFRNRLPDLAGKAGNDLRLTATGGGDIRFHMLRVRPLTTVTEATPRPAPRPTLSPATPEPLATARAGQVILAVTPTPEPTAAPTRTVATEIALPTPVITGNDVLRYQVPGTGRQVDDTYISSQAAQTETAAPATPAAPQDVEPANTLLVSADGSREALLRFDLSDLPADRTVAAAWLELTVVGRSQPVTMTLEAYPVARAWSADTATWQEAAAGRAWAGPGLAVPADRAAAPAATLDLPVLGAVQVALTGQVAEWVSHPERNHGLVLRGTAGGNVDYYLASSEWRNATARPRLRIRLAGDGAVTAATPAATPAAAPGDSDVQVPRRGPAARPAENAVRAAIAEVRPADGATADENLIDVTAYLYGPDGQSPDCDATRVVRLWAAAGQHPAAPVAVGVQRMATGDGKTFPAWDFNGIDARALRGEESLLQLFVTVDGADTQHNIVTLGDGQGTYYPQPSVPTTAATDPGSPLDASIEILWPQNAGAPAATGFITGTAGITGTSRANISVALFQHGTRAVMPATAGAVPTVRLHWSVGSGPDLAGVNPPAGQPRLVHTPWLSYYLWDWTDVDVRPAAEPGKYINFWVEVVGHDSYPNVWSHGSGPHAQPQAPLPAGSCR